MSVSMAGGVMQKMIRVGLAAGLLLAVGGCMHAETVQEKAMKAYKAGDYAAALPLLKKWAADPKYFVNNLPPKEAMAYILDCEAKLKGTGNGQESGASSQKSVVSSQKGGGGGAGGGTGASVLPAIPGTASSSSLDAQAMAVGAAQSGQDIPMGADRIPHPPYKPGTLLVTSIKGLANFEYDPVQGGDIPADVQQLNGAKIRVRGFMIPMTEAEQIKEFALVPSLVSCCFGQPPGVQHVFTCHLPKGRAVDYCVDEIEVEGTLRIHMERADGYTSSIFDVDVESVKTVE
ncbi:MAG TPA: DUF3299 domain-containing protein [Phycisphaerae bacterium]|nr:DUF3299 domain-containing protein [Phycisphaerae bacterium]